ncbi:hypothetical protein LUZ63_013859 [Rhynchospora breviuscula]|uniref:Uncharacterized protein n=1 Tax=Rhynchospora breviuscula TaxID=2022672 RepID=A0A9Q0C9S9_9POAL|nr:hypothetical protein LUZ63_013859 [Rhynchospora breviuscula]
MVSSVTTSAVGGAAETGSHLFKVLGYSVTEGIGIGNWISSDVFTIGGYDWVILFYPDGNTIEDEDFISVFLELKSTDANVKAEFAFSLLQPNGAPTEISYTCPVKTFTATGTNWGYPNFAKRSDFEEYINDDAFIIECTITVVTRLQATTPYGITVPPSNLNQHLIDSPARERGDAADNTFVVKEERFKAHRCLLAARSAVFNGELFGGMRENWMDTITVEDIEAPVFKSMLYFIYSDALTDFEDNNDDCDGEEQDSWSLPQHLLVAADR